MRKYFSIIALIFGVIGLLIPFIGDLFFQLFTNSISFAIVISIKLGLNSELVSRNFDFFMVPFSCLIYYLFGLLLDLAIRKRSRGALLGLVLFLAVHVFSIILSMAAIAGW